VPGIKETKPKIINTLDHVISNLQAESSVADVEWQAVQIAREVLAQCSTLQLARAIEAVQKKLSSRA
jgi:hypothetical protein